jgi:hypothetical protein
MSPRVCGIWNTRYMVRPFEEFVMNLWESVIDSPVAVGDGPLEVERDTSP